MRRLDTRSAARLGCERPRAAILIRRSVLNLEIVDVQHLAGPGSFDKTRQ